MSVLAICFWCYPMFRAFGQAIQNQYSYRYFPKESYLRTNYENDLFTGTDYYYTQGVYLEMVTPWLQKSPLYKLLTISKQAKQQYGIALELNGYTPTSIERNYIQYGDRPFAGVMLIKNFVISIDSGMKIRWISALSSGMIGPATGGFEIQKEIHKRTGDPLPEGWQFQVKNNLVLNYELAIEKALLFQCPRYVLLNATALVRAGSLSSKGELGAIAMAGLLPDIFSLNKYERFHLYLYDHFNFQVIAYDAGLQGGAIPKDDPYTLGNRELNRIVLQNRIGLVFNYRSFYLEYYEQYKSKEFKTGLSHRSGGVQLGIGF